MIIRIFDSVAMQFVYFSEPPHGVRHRTRHFNRIYTVCKGASVTREINTILDIFGKRTTVTIYSDKMAVTICLFSLVSAIER